MPDSLYEVGTNRENFMGQPIRWLAGTVHADLVETPGGHGGYMEHPKEFASATPTQRCSSLLERIPT